MTCLRRSARSTPKACPCCSSNRTSRWRWRFPTAPMCSKKAVSWPKANRRHCWRAPKSSAPISAPKRIEYLNRRHKTMLFPTTIVGSFPQPEWLIDRAKLAGRFPPRVRAKELWRIPPQYLAEAQDDATLIAIRAQEAAGLDIVSDGEIRRESYSNRFATALEGIDLDNPGTGLDRSGHPNPVPRIVGKIRRMHSVQVEDLKFLLRHTT